MRSVGQFLVLLGTSSLLALGCSANAPMSPDAAGGGGTADARGGGNFPDAQNVRPDANTGGGPDAMVQVECEGDDTEPNDTQLGAQMLPNSTDCDYDPKNPVPGEGGLISGAVISGNEDWFTYSAEDVTGCAIDPHLVLVGNVQVCMLFNCLEGDTELTCPNGTTAVGGGQIGCCGDSSFDVEDYNCTGIVNFDESSQVHLQVTPLSTDTCETYTIEYSF